MNAALPDDIVLDALVLFIRELGHYPVTTEFRMRRRADPSFPDHKVYRRFGTKPELAARVIEHVGKDPDMDSVVASCRPIAALAAPPDAVEEGGLVAGAVYLMKSGNYYKIGRSDAVGRRAYERERTAATTGTRSRCGRPPAWRVSSGTVLQTG